MEARSQPARHGGAPGPQEYRNNRSLDDSERLRTVVGTSVCTSKLFFFPMSQVRPKGEKVGEIAAKAVVVWNTRRGMWTKSHSEALTVSSVKVRL